MKLTTEQLDYIVDFWMLCLPKDIHAAIFKQNLKNYLDDVKNKRVVLKVDYDANELLKLLVNGGIDTDKNKFYDNANPSHHRLEVSFASPWPEHGVYAEKIGLLIENSDNKIEVYAAIGRGSEYEILDEEYLKRVLMQQNGQQKNSFHKSPSTWSEIMPSHLVRKCFSENDYYKIVNLARTLEDEISSKWPYPHKDRKKIELNALRALLTVIERQPYKSLKECVNQIRREHPQALLGTFSPRVRELLNKLVPENSITIDEDSNKKKITETTSLLSERIRPIHHDLDLLKEQIIKTFTPCLRHNGCFSLFQTIKPYDRPAREIIKELDSTRINPTTLKNILNKTLTDIRKKNYGKNEFLVNLELFIVDCEQLEDIQIKNKKIGTQVLTKVGRK